MNTTLKNASSQPDNSPMTAAPQAFREMAEKGTTQAKENYEKMSGAATEAADFINKVQREGHRVRSHQHPRRF